MTSERQVADDPLDSCSKAPQLSIDPGRLRHLIERDVTSFREDHVLNAHGLELDEMARRPRS